MKSLPLTLLTSFSLLISLLMVPSGAFPCAGDHHDSRMLPANRNYENAPLAQRSDLDLNIDIGDRQADFRLVIEEDIAPTERYRRPGRRGLSKSFRYKPWGLNLRDDVRLIEHERPRRRAKRTPKQPKSFKPELDSRRIARILAALEDEPFSDGQLEIISEAGRRFDLTTRQAIRLVKHLSFDSDRVQALGDLYPSVIDPENFIEVYSLLSFSSDRKELRRRVSR